MEIVSDNGPQYIGKAYQDMCNTWSVKHTTSSPRYPRSNGLAERTVRTVKSLITKCRKTGQDIHQALLNLRATPIDTGLSAPAEIMFGHPIRTTLPSNDPLQKPSDTFQRLQNRQEHMKTQHDQHTGPALPPLFVGQKVRILKQSDNTWIPVEVTKVRKEPMSYEVSTPNGTTLRRNRARLREMFGKEHKRNSPMARCRQSTTSRACRKSEFALQIH